MNSYFLKPSFILNVGLHLKFRRNVSTTSAGQYPSNNYSIEEIKIPYGKRDTFHIGCKVWRWKGDARNSSKVAEPPIICAHGWLDNANTFDPLIPLIIRPNRTFYAFDLPGQGISSHVRTTHYNNHTESHMAIHRVLRHLKFDKFTLLGHSMGGKACVMYAATYPEGLQKLCTIDGVNPYVQDWVQSVKLFAQHIFEVEESLEKHPEQPPSTYEKLLGRMMRAREGVVFEEGCRILLKRNAVKVKGSEDKYVFTHDVKQKIYPGMAMMTTEQMTQFCARVRAPWCVIKASKGDSVSGQPSIDFLTAVKNAKSQNDQLNTEFYMVEGTHHVHLNEPSKVASIIDAFLSK